MKHTRIAAALAAGATAAMLAVAGCQAPEDGGSGTTGSSQQKKDSGPSVQEKRAKEWDKVMEHNEEGQGKFTADILKGYATSDGTPSEQDAVSHVTRVQQSPPDSMLPTADIYTDLTGDMFSSDGSTGQLIVATYKGYAAEQGLGDGSGGGLVTIYNASGEMIANGNF